MSSPADNRTLSYAEAVFEATRSEMARDPKVFVMGQVAQELETKNG